MEKKYWDHFYADHLVTETPSNFAKFVSNHLNKTDTTALIDIGCGNGRDSIFFASQGIKALGIDQSEVSICKLEEKYPHLSDKLSFKTEDFCRCNFDSLISGSYAIYSRFTLHAINYDEEFAFLSNLELQKNNKVIFIEARSIHDDIYGDGINVGQHEFITSHYRRFIDPERLKTQLEKFCKVTYFEESNDFSKTETDNPRLIRVIALPNFTNN